MSAVLENGFAATIAEAGSQLNISVIFTSIESTLSALRTAGNLAGALNGRITLIVPHVIPCPLPLGGSAGVMDHNRRRFRVIAGSCPVETTVRMYLCRDRDALLNSVLRPHSLIVLGSHKSWWPTAEARLARRLRRAGHEVVVATE